MVTNREVSHPSDMDDPMGWTRLPVVAWQSEALFYVPLERREIEERFGPASTRDCDSNGMGSFDAWMIRFACGLEVSIWLFTGERPAVEVHANEAETEHILFHLGAAGAAVVMCDPADSPAPRRFRLLRADDNGGTFEMVRFTSRCEATAAARVYEARGHKQLYWVERV